MDAMRESWTDRRLDEFRAGTERRLDRIDGRLDAIDQRFEAIDQRFEAIDRRFADADKRFEMFEGHVKEGFARVDNDLREIRTQMVSLQRTLLQLCGGMIATIALGFVSLIVTHV